MVTAVGVAMDTRVPLSYCSVPLILDEVDCCVTQSFVTFFHPNPSFYLKEICTLSLATEFAGDRMTTVNFFGLVLCLIGISVHVVTKATRGRFHKK